MDINTAVPAHSEPDFAEMTGKDRSNVVSLPGGGETAGEARIAPGLLTVFIDIDLILFHDLGQKTGELSEDHALDWDLL